MVVKSITKKDASILTTLNLKKWKVVSDKPKAGGLPSAFSFIPHKLNIAQQRYLQNSCAAASFPCSQGHYRVPYCLNLKPLLVIYDLIKLTYAADDMRIALVAFSMIG